MKRIMTAIIGTMFLVGSLAGVAVAADPPLPLTPQKQAAPAVQTEMMRATGTVQAYEQGKNIQISSSGGGLLTFGIAPKTKVSGTIEKGAWVVVIYEKQKDAFVANKIAVGAR